MRCVYIASDGGRVCRPLVIADNGVSRIKHHHMEELKDGAHNFDSFLREGLIEYLDVNEENNSLIALYEGEATSETTHIEIEPFTILGVCAGLIPFPHHNQSPRNTYQCAMGKQAMGNIAYNQLCRMDTLIYLLVYPQRPLLTTRTIELVGYDKLGAGQNATVAVMSYSGYDIEDAIVMNKSSLDRGFGRSKYEKYENACDQLSSPRKSHHDPEKIQILDNDGLASPGEIIRHEDIYLQKKCPINPNAKSHPSQIQYRPSKQTYKGAEGEPAVVDRVALCSDDKQKLVTSLVADMAKKGVCDTIVQQEDFPFSERGICPDLIMNPHGFPSRMTVGKMIELLGSKAGVSCGKFHYGSAFGEPSGHAHKVEDISETLVKHGFSYNGKDFLYSGITGTPLQAYIFMGPIHYQKLKHMVGFTPQPPTQPAPKVFVPSTIPAMRNADQYQQAPSLGSQIYSVNASSNYRVGPPAAGSLGTVPSPMVPTPVQKMSQDVGPTPQVRGFMPMPISNSGVQRTSSGQMQPPSPTPPAAPSAPPPTVHTADVSNVPVHQRAVISSLMRLFTETSEAMGGAHAVPAKKREIDDNSKKLGALFVKLNSGDISKNASEKLVKLCQALDCGDFPTALKIQVDLTTSDWDECSFWLATLKRMIKIRQTAR
ncbi:hypothetical protein L1987_06149 [Smallanthus sonchifolius]|uniref:Uncharacterized protein n=1 Tax=Smallanthus sonchifolius TaxID=185202 RepID=A0ACB9JXH9_9ASTR|nr:hypothetical protein L1987_06149 [Smallanthus sonchifolius]